MDWKTVAEKIVHDDQNKWDQRYLAEELEVAKLGADVWPFSDLAMSQFCGRLRRRAAGDGLPAYRAAKIPN